MKPKILITGSSGYIGKILAKKLSKKYTTYLIDKIKQDKEKNFYHIDLKDKKKLNEFFRNNKVDINLYNQMKKISNIKLYEEYIEIDEFQKVMQNSNLLFTDLNTNYKSSYISEVYGISKDSGISYLMCEFNLPCLLNGDFNNFEELNSGSLYFNSLNEMSKKYYKIKNDIEYRKKIFNNMSHDTKKFNIEYFSEYLKKKFLENNLF